MANDSRIGSNCWYKLDKEWGKSAKWKAGILRAWSTNYETCSNGIRQFPVGIVEDNETLRCVIVHVEQITFAAVPE